MGGYIQCAHLIERDLLVIIFLERYIAGKDDHGADMHINSAEF